MTFSLTIKTAEDLAGEAQAAAQAQLVAMIDAHVEAQAKALGYNSAAHLAGYKDSTVAAWSAEASAFIAWRDQVWLAAYTLQAEHAAAQTMPAPADVMAALPVWGDVE